MPPANQHGGNPPVSGNKQTVTELAQRGDTAGALNLCTTLCEHSPDDPELWFLLGAIHGALANHEEAETCCRKAIELAPSHPMLRYNLGLTLLKQNRIADAIREFRRATELQPDFADAWRELGNAQYMNHEAQAALSSYRKSAELDPASAVTAFNLGNVCLDLDRRDEAMSCFRQAISLQPEFVEAYARLSTALIQQYRFDQVIDLLVEATERMPHAASLYSLLATACHEQGDADSALKYYEKALSVDPDSVNARTGLAGILALQGNYAKAGEMLERLLAENPEDTTVRTAFTTFAHKFGATDRAIEIAECDLQSGSMLAHSRTRHHFSLAQLYESNGDPGSAFRHYEAGNRSRNARYDHASYRQMFRALIDTFSEEALAHLPRSGNRSDVPLFIVGMPRSGTSLVEHILASHPDVSGAGELHSINQIVHRLPQTLETSTPYPHCIDSLTTATLDRLAGQYLEQLHERSAGAGRRITDKMPVNFIHLGLISLLFPNARIIHCTRDPMDTCLSCYCKLFSGELPFAYSLTDLGRYYRLYRELMTHWKTVLDLPIHDVSYEELVNNQESETRRLIDFCELPWNDACLQFHQTARTIATASHDQVRQPMYTSSIGRWRVYEKHLEPLFAALESDD